MSNKQSSVEWTIDELTKLHALIYFKEIGVKAFNRFYKEIIERAKAMHEEEITQSHTTGYVIGGGDGELYDPKQYYNETFGDNNEQ